MRFTTTRTITSFSFGRLSAIIRVSATRVLSAMRFPFDGTMLSGSRIFCDYHFASQFFLKGIVDMLADGFCSLA